MEAMDLLQKENVKTGESRNSFSECASLLNRNKQQKADEFDGAMSFLMCTTQMDTVVVLAQDEKPGSTSALRLTGRMFKSLSNQSNTTRIESNPGLVVGDVVSEVGMETQLQMDQLTALLSQLPMDSVSKQYEYMQKEKTSWNHDPILVDCVRKMGKGEHMNNVAFIPNAIQTAHESRKLGRFAYVAAYVSMQQDKQDQFEVKLSWKSPMCWIVLDSKINQRAKSQEMSPHQSFLQSLKSDEKGGESYDCVLSLSRGDIVILCSESWLNLYRTDVAWSMQVGAALQKNLNLKETIQALSPTGWNGVLSVVRVGVNH